jgi:hypothetical protein
MIPFAALLLAATPSAAPAEAGPSEQSFAGPALVCGEGFALRLAAGESATRRDPGVDFILYYVRAADGPFLLYAGNAPQPHDDELRTGLSFPSVIAIHDNRDAAAKARSRIRDRLLVGAARPASCPEGQVQG